MEDVLLLATYVSSEDMRLFGNGVVLAIKSCFCSSLKDVMEEPATVDVTAKSPPQSPLFEPFLYTKTEILYVPLVGSETKIFVVSESVYVKSRKIVSSAESFRLTESFPPFLALYEMTHCPFDKEFSFCGNVSKSATSAMFGRKAGSFLKPAALTMFFMSCCVASSVGKCVQIKYFGSAKSHVVL